MRGAGTSIFRVCLDSTDLSLSFMVGLGSNDHALL